MMNGAESLSRLSRIVFMALKPSLTAWAPVAAAAAAVPPGKALPVREVIRSAFLGLWQSFCSNVRCQYEMCYWSTEIFYPSRVRFRLRNTDLARLTLLLMIQPHAFPLGGVCSH